VVFEFSAVTDYRIFAIKRQGPKKTLLLVERAREGERIGITRCGKLAAVLTSAPPQTSLKEAFEDIERIRKRAKPPRGVNVKSLVEEGRV
jgi:antitoxin (DNA-binding transcriptional repressor) of toxin-antitoxin stability system